MSEKQIQSKFLVFLKKNYPGWWVKLSDKWMSGILDILGCYQGKFVHIEIKDTGKKPTELQQHTINKVTEAGGIAFFGDSFDSLQSQTEVYLGRGTGKTKKRK